MGKMEELGKNSEKLHESILKEASSVFDMVLALDFLAKLDSPNIKFIKRNELHEELNKYLSENFLVFFKGSRSVKMEEIIKTII
jgi:UDP-N-acetylmuramyl pentapeptide synthase